MVWSGCLQGVSRTNLASTASAQRRQMGRAIAALLKERRRNYSRLESKEITG